MFCSNVEFVPLIGLILKEGNQVTWYKGFWPRPQPASSRTGSEAKQSDSKTCALDCLGAGRGGRGGPSYILIMANRAGPRWQGCSGIILHWGNQGPVQGNLRSQGRMTEASKTGRQQPFSATQSRKGNHHHAHPVEGPSRKKAKEKRLASSPPDMDSAPTLCLNCSPDPICGRQRNHLRGGKAGRIGSLDYHPPVPVPSRTAWGRV